MSTLLVICMGNTARGDDGVAHVVGAMLKSAFLGKSVRILCVTGLDIALAEPVAAIDRLIIVDAERRSSPAVEITGVAPCPSSSPTGHGIDAPGLLALAESLYGASPETQLVSLAAPEMDHGDVLSSVAQGAAAEAFVRISGLISS